METKPKITSVIVEDNNLSESPKKNIVFIDEDEVNKEIKNFMSDFINEEKKKINKEKKDVKILHIHFKL